MLILLRLMSLTILIVATSCRTNEGNKTGVEMGTSNAEITSKSNIDLQKLKEAVDYLASKSYEDGVSELLIIKEGEILYAGDSIDRKHNIYSCSKAFTSTVLGLLIDRGKCELDDFAVKYDSSLMEHYPAVTLRHFATMTSGYSAKGRSRWENENADWSWTPYQPEKPHFAPGSHYEYWDEAQMAFGKVLTKILQEPMKDFLQKELTDHLGMGEWEWHPEQETENGIPINNGCTNVILNASQLATFGLFYLNRGKWGDRQLLSEEFATAATSMQVPSTVPVYEGDRANVKGSGSYGFNWWVNSEDGLSKMPDAPLGVAYMSGLNHNVCAIVPEWDMVIVRMGDDKNPPEGKHVIWNEFLKRIKKAL